jgi:hypothetical protein
VHLVGFIVKKFVTMHGHMNVKFVNAKQAMETYQYRKTKKKKSVQNQRGNMEFHPGLA